MAKLTRIPVPIPVPAPTPTITTTPVSSGQIDTVSAVVREWSLNEQTGKVTLNFHKGRLSTIVKEQTLRLPL